MHKEKPKVLISYSAGIDSTVAAYLYKSKGYEVVLGIFDDGPMNKPGDMFFDKSKQVEMSNLSEEYYTYLALHPFEYVELRYPQLNALCATSIASKGGESATAAEDIGLDFWVGFKQLMGTILLSYGAANGFEAIVFGHMPYNDHYEDEKPENFQKLRELFVLNYGSRVKVPEIWHPFYEPELDSKEKVIQKGLDLGVKLENTYSCRRGARDLTTGKYFHCGTCENCKERARAFRVLGAKDPAHHFYRPLTTIA